MPGTLTSFVFHAAARFAERPALLTAERTITHGELNAMIERAAVRLREHGVEEERVGLLLPNVPVLPVALYGLLRARARVVLLNPANSPRELREHLADCGATTVLTSERLVAMLPEGARVIQVAELATATAPEGHEPVEAAYDPDAAGPLSVEGDEEAVVVYTSANEGWARGARLSHASLIANACSTVEAMQLTEQDRVIAALPLIHLFGLTVTLNAPLSVGAAVLPLERFSPGRLLELLRETQATVICGVPAMYMALLSAAEKKGAPDHALRVAISGGAPLPLEVARRWEELFRIPLRQGYGLTEAGPVCLFNRVDRPNRMGTLGYPFPAVEIGLRDEAGRELPPGEVGEICVRGANVFLGYVGESGRNPRDFFGDWLRTGDLGSTEAGGAIRFRGFLKPMFTRNGFNVYPREIARVLEEDPRIERVLVCALPDPGKENEVVLYVHPAPSERLTEEEVRALCAERLAAYKQPGRIYLEWPEARGSSPVHEVQRQREEGTGSGSVAAGEDRREE